MRELIALLVLAAAPAAATEEPAGRALQRLQTREDRLGAQAREADEAARRSARDAYRLARRRELGFLGAPERRREAAAAADLSALALGRAAGEARAIREELDRVREDRQALQAALARPRPPTTDAPPPLARPCRGPIVAAPGLRQDDAAGITLRQETVEILSRMNEPVVAPAAGRVRRIEALPQGGFAVVVAHDGGWVSILSGLRDVAVTPGQTVAAREALGLTGRNLDGAPVVSFELARGRVSVDPRPYLERDRPAKRERGPRRTRGLATTAATARR